MLLYLVRYRDMINLDWFLDTPSLYTPVLDFDLVISSNSDFEFDKRLQARLQRSQ